MGKTTRVQLLAFVFLSWTATLSAGVVITVTSTADTAANDGVCKAVWEDNHKRFLESGKPRQDKPIDPFAATPDSRMEASPAQGELPKDIPQSPATQNSNPPALRATSRGK